jgi:hypothetical protein
MRLSGHIVANAVAWAVIIGLIALAFVMVTVLGPFGLILLGLFTMFVCTSFRLSDDVPTWGVEVFRPRMSNDDSSERRAARFAEKRSELSSVRFYNGCGAVLIVAGILGFLWQQYG